MTGHRIDKETIELYCSSEERVGMLRQQLEHFILPELERVMGEALDQVAPGPGWARIERLEVDLGEMTLAEWGDAGEVVRRFGERVRERVRALGIVKAEGPGSDMGEGLGFDAVLGTGPGSGYVPGSGEGRFGVSGLSFDDRSSTGDRGASRGVERGRAAVRGGSTDAEGLPTGGGGVSDEAGGLAGAGGLLPEIEMEWEMVRSFLRSGWLPWWAKKGELPDMDILMRRVSGRMPGRVRDWMGASQSAAVWQRVGTFSAGTRGALAGLLDGVGLPDRRVVMRRLEALFAAAGDMEGFDGGATLVVRRPWLKWLFRSREEEVLSAVREALGNRTVLLAVILLYMPAGLMEALSAAGAGEAGLAGQGASGDGERSTEIRGAERERDIGGEKNWPEIKRRGWVEADESGKGQAAAPGSSAAENPGRMVRRGSKDRAEDLGWGEMGRGAVGGEEGGEAGGEGRGGRSVGEQREQEQGGSGEEGRGGSGEQDPRGRAAVERNKSGSGERREAGEREKGGMRMELGGKQHDGRGVKEKMKGDRMEVNEPGRFILKASERRILEEIIKKRAAVTVGEEKLLAKLAKKISQQDLIVLRRLVDLPEEKVNDLLSTGLQDTTNINTDGEGMDRILIENAGLCLFAPYLPSFFGKLGYLQPDRMRDKRAAGRAVRLLQYVATGRGATGREEAPEYLLPLNKILCGLSPDEVVMLPARLSKKEMAEADRLVEAVIANWTALKSTSSNGLRGSFVCREGIITDAGVRWVLRVERKEYDLLLKSLPWGYAYIKLPWMIKQLEVEW